MIIAVDGDENESYCKSGRAFASRKMPQSTVFRLGALAVTYREMALR